MKCSEKALTLVRNYGLACEVLGWEYTEDADSDVISEEIKLLEYITELEEKVNEVFKEMGA